MTDIKHIKEELKLDKKLESNLKLLVEYCIKHKSLIFELNIKDIDFEVLLKSQIITIESKKYKVKNFSIFTTKFNSHFIESLNPELSKNFKSFTKYLNQIESEFKSNRFNQEFKSLKKELWKQAILEANEKYNVDFVDYLDTIDPEIDKKEIYSFNEGFSIAIPFLKISTESFIYNINQLFRLTKSDVEYDIPLSVLLNGIRNHFYENSEFGLKCFKLASKQKAFEIELLIPMITGLFDKLGLNFYNKNLEKLKDVSFSTSIICGLSNVHSVKENEAKVFLELYGKTDKKNHEILIYLPRLIFAILNSKLVPVNSKNIEESFICLEELISIDNPKLIQIILRELRFGVNHPIYKKRLILKLIKQSHFQIDKYLYSIDHIISKQKEINFFEQVIDLLAINISFKPVSSLLGSSISKFLTNDKKNLDEVIIRLLINDSACHRFIGIDIYNEISQKSYTFDFNILNLDHLDQYKLWVSVLQFYREPKYVLPCLLPLLDSKSSFVKESFISKLEEYTENYGGGVAEVLKKKLDLDSHKSKIIYKRIEKYQEDFFNTFVKVKEDIKEINPYYTQNKIFSEFNRNYFRNMSRQFKKITDESSSVMNLFTKVTLLKGGGWKSKGDEKVSKLANFGQSFTLPRICFIESEYFDFEKSRELDTNWDESYFEVIKDFLDNE